MKRTSIVLDEKILADLKRLTGIKTARAVVDYALREALRHCRQRGILKLRGRVEWQGDLDEMRKERHFR